MSLRHQVKQMPRNEIMIKTENNEITPTFVHCPHSDMKGATEEDSPTISLTPEISLPT
jgi:hypothetical protein